MINTMQELIDKYSNIEDKIPSVFENYNKAALEMSKDICMLWHISHFELIRVIVLLDSYTGGVYNLSKHTNYVYSFAGLYPHVQKSHNMDLNQLKQLADELTEKRKNRK